MSGISAEMKDEYGKIRKKIEEIFPGRKVVSITNFLYPVFKQKLKYTVSSVRECSMLEEFVMKASALELSLKTDVGILSSLLGMDEVFLTDTINTLAQKDVINKDSLPYLEITEYGREHLNALTFPSGEETEEIEYYIDKKFAVFYTEPVPAQSCEVWGKYCVIDEKVENKKKYINRRFVADILKAMGKSPESGSDGKNIKSLVSAKTTGEASTLIAEVEVMDEADGKTGIMIWDYALQIFREDIAGVLECDIPAVGVQ